MTVEMLIGGFIILMVVAVIVVTMTSARSGTSSNGDFDEYVGKRTQGTKRR